MLGAAADTPLEQREEPAKVPLDRAWKTVGVHVDHPDNHRRFQMIKGDSIQ
jgi:hypothetical protein